MFFNKLFKKRQPQPVVVKQSSQAFWTSRWDKYFEELTSGELYRYQRDRKRLEQSNGS